MARQGKSGGDKKPQRLGLGLGIEKRKMGDRDAALNPGKFP